MKKHFVLLMGMGLSDIDIAESIRFHREHGKLATVTAVAPQDAMAHWIVKVARS